MSILFEPLLSDQIAQNHFTILPVTAKHAAILTTLASHQPDLIDRLLIAQTLVEAMRIISTDSVLDAFPVTRLW